MSPARRLAIVLVAVAVLLGGVLIAQQFGFGTGYTLAEGSGTRKPRDYLAGLGQDGFKLAPFTDFGELVSRPVFNEDRRPTPIEEKPADGAAQVATVPDLDVTLTSIIHTPDKKLAIVRDNKSNASLVVKLGMPLEGEQSGWKLVEVAPRKVVFEGEGAGRKELELSVNESAMARAEGEPAAAPPANPAQPAVAQQAPADTDAANQAKAEEIRRRIEERRRQLREEAERMRAQESSQ